MTDVRIEIGSYSGYRGEESPRVFFAHGKKITVTCILRMWVAEEESGRRRRRFFRVEGGDGFTHTLYYDEETQEWFCREFERNAT
ncbi:MAG TPA: hypothetical protein VL197_11855 [Nitrospirota bacterium]|nr:hypothetical protein [Nitrospirota bacterium]